MEILYFFLQKANINIEVETANNIGITIILFNFQNFTIVKSTGDGLPLSRFILIESFLKNFDSHFELVTLSFFSLVLFLVFLYLFSFRLDDFLILISNFLELFPMFFLLLQIEPRSTPALVLQIAR